MATAAQKANALITHYVKLYKAKYKKEPEINRYRERWGFQAMIEDLGDAEARLVIEHYFETGKIGHPVQYLLHNYDRLAKIRRELEEDKANRLRLREQTRLRVQEWERVNGGTEKD